MSRIARRRVPGLFIAGTDTEVGKTYVASQIARQLSADGMRVGVYKPVASGAVVVGDQLVSHDAQALWEAAGRPGKLERVCPQVYQAPLAPHLAARQAGREVDAQLLRDGLDYWLSESDVILVEGAGGLMTPVADETYVADLAFEFKFPLVIVAPNQLGVINQTLQTLMTAAAYRDGIPVRGVVLNDVRVRSDDTSVTSNRAELDRRCTCPVLAHVSHGAERLDHVVDWLGG